MEKDFRYNLLVERMQLIKAKIAEIELFFPGMENEMHKLFNAANAVEEKALPLTVDSKELAESVKKIMKNS